MLFSCNYYFKTSIIEFLLMMVSVENPQKHKILKSENPQNWESSNWKSSNFEFLRIFALRISSNLNFWGFFDLRHDISKCRTYETQKIKSVVEKNRPFVFDSTRWENNFGNKIRALNHFLSPGGRFLVFSIAIFGVSHSKNHILL